MTVFLFHVALHLFHEREEVSLFPNKENHQAFLHLVPVSLSTFSSIITQRNVSLLFLTGSWLFSEATGACKAFTCFKSQQIGP